MLGLSNSSNFDISKGVGAFGAKQAGVMGGEPNLASIIASVQNDIKNLRTQLDNIPSFPKGNFVQLINCFADQRPPSPLARF